MYDEKDYVLRQIKQLVLAMGKFLTRDSLKDIINIEVGVGNLLNDAQIDAIIMMSQLRQKQEEMGWSDEVLADKVGMSMAQLLLLEEGAVEPTADEISRLSDVQTLTE